MLNASGGPPPFTCSTKVRLCGPAHKGLIREEPDGRVRRQSGLGRTARQQHVAGWQRDGRSAAVEHYRHRPAAESEKVVNEGEQDHRLTYGRSERTSGGKGPAIERQCGFGVVLLGRGSQGGPLGRLRDPWLSRARAEPERRRFARPWQRHPASVTTGFAGGQGLRVLPV